MRMYVCMWMSACAHICLHVCKHVCILADTFVVVVVVVVDDKPLVITHDMFLLLFN